MNMIAGRTLGDNTFTVIVAVGIFDVRSQAGFDCTICRTACGLAVRFAGMAVEMVAGGACNRDTCAIGRTIHR